MLKHALLLLTFTAGSLAQSATAAKQLTIENIFAEGGITGRAPEPIEWSPDGKKLAYLVRDNSGEHGEIWYVDVTARKPAVLVSERKLDSLLQPPSKIKSERERANRERYHVAAFHWAPDSKHLLFDSNGQFWLYSLDTQTGIPMTSSPEPAADPKFSPDGTMISYIRNSNLVVEPVSGKTERALTASKDPNILNGEVDWLYEEELEARSNYFWSPDSKRIVFLQSDETHVPTFSIEDYLPLNPTVYEEKYPKAGDPNPVVRLGVVGASGGRVRWITLPEQKVNDENAPANPVGSESDIYVPRFGWVNQNLLYAEVLNRAQNEQKLYFIDPSSGSSKLMLDERSDTWIELTNQILWPSNYLVFLSHGRFLWASWRDGHEHIYRYRYNQSDPMGAAAALEQQLTQGDYDVLDINAVDETKGLIYFTANRADPRRHDLYSVRLDGGEAAQISREHGVHQVIFADDNNNYADLFSARMTPPQLELCSTNGACDEVWHSADISAYELTPPQELEFKADDGATLYGELYLPPGEHAPGSLPLIMNPYGGPQAQSVMDEWGRNGFLFDELLAREGIATLTVDNRGMGGRGKKFEAAIWHDFGPVELKDQLAALDQALAKFPALDSKRIAWWGWSFGGYMTLYTMTHSDRFLAGVSVAPVSDWRDYDSAYTERYMGLPQEHKDEYEKSSPVNTATSLKGEVLIVHGTGDDNVHVQNTLQMTEALLAAHKKFELMLYPGKTHGIAGAQDETDLFHRIHDVFRRALLGHD